jgi:hypothetical protein
MAFSGVVGTPWITTAWVTQTGRFRMGPDRPWMPVTAIRTFITDLPGFFWNARFKMYGLPLFRARDSYKDGHGHMFGKLTGVFNIFDARGPEMDLGSLVRYLGEMIWFPSAFLGKNASWQIVDENAAQVTVTDAGASATARLVFDEQGRPTLFAATRYQEQHGQY